MITIEAVIALLGLLLTAAIALATWAHAIYRKLNQLCGEIQKICGEVHSARQERKRLWKTISEVRDGVRKLREQHTD